jgi:signal peptidase I
VKRLHIREILEIVALGLLIFVGFRFILQSYQINTPAMEPALSTNTSVLVNKVAYVFRGPERGDVVVFRYPRNPDIELIARVIGLPGDTIKVNSQQIWVNGKELKEPYVKDATNPIAKTWKVPANQYFVMGDNRSLSNDSRRWDFLPSGYIVGKAVVVYWPFSQWQIVNSYSDTYR